jgi:hypothetical protein
VTPTAGEHRCYFPDRFPVSILPETEKAAAEDLLLFRGRRNRNPRPVVALPAPSRATTAFTS